MSFIRDLVVKQHHVWAEERFNYFIKTMTPKKGERILDLGGSQADFFYWFKDKVNDLNLHIVIADINKKALQIAKDRGFETILVDENFVNFPDQSFDIIFCNSVIEHVTVPKDQVWGYTDDNEFKTTAWNHQRDFSEQIRRIGRGYFVQTPHRNFLIESHSWLPFVVNLFNRKTQIKILRVSNKYWVKSTAPDWHLLDEKQMHTLFPDAEEIVLNRKVGCPKEVIALKRPSR